MVVTTTLVTTYVRIPFPYRSENRERNTTRSKLKGRVRQEPFPPDAGHLKTSESDATCEASFTTRLGVNRIDDDSFLRRTEKSPMAIGQLSRARGYIYICGPDKRHVTKFHYFRDLSLAKKYVQACEESSDFFLVACLLLHRDNRTTLS